MGRLIALLMATALLLIPALACGEELRLEPSIGVKGEYTSNIFLTEYAKLHDYRSVLSPGVSMVYRTGRFDSELLARLDRIDYAKYTDLSATDQTYRGNLRYAMTERFGIAAEASFIRDSQPDRDLQTTGLVLLPSSRNRITGMFSSDYRFTEKTAGVVSYLYGHDDFRNPRQADSTTQVFGGALVHDIGGWIPSGKARLDVGHSSYSFPDMQLNALVIKGGLSGDITERWSVQFEGGGIRTQSDFNILQQVRIAPFEYRTVAVPQSTAGWGWTGKVALTYKDEKTTGSLSFSKDLQPASGTGGATDRNTAALEIRHRMTYELTLFVNAEYYTNKSEPLQYSTQLIDQRSLRVAPGLRYDFSRDIALTALYEHARYEDRAVRTTAMRHLFSLGLTMKHALLE